ncbi:MAG: hypothetical protein ACYTG0_30905 [Planctomycetota bacterium]
MSNLILRREKPPRPGELVSDVGATGKDDAQGHERDSLPCDLHCVKVNDPDERPAQLVRLHPLVRPYPSLSRRQISANGTSLVRFSLRLSDCTQCLPSRIDNPLVFALNKRPNRLFYRWASTDIQGAFGILSIFNA